MDGWRAFRIVGVVALVVAPLVTGASPAAADPPGQPTALIDAPARGAEAIAALGDRIGEAAGRNRLTTTALQQLLRTDRSAGVARDGQVFFTDPVAASTGSTVAAPAATVTDPFTLHTRPGALRTIYLDLDGGPVSGTQWNESFGVPSTTYPGFDQDGNPASFSATERAAVQSIFERVAEDFAPFDVDVTTQDPGAAAIARDSATDTRYGTRVLVTTSTVLSGAICASSCGGVAYLSVFDAPNGGYHQPALVFPHLLATDAKNIAEAASHEVGHTLGLSHDGVTGGAAYYEGQGAWAPIMGASYYRPITQWSSGEYSGANNTQDDLAVMQSRGLPLRADDHANTTAGATVLPVGASVTTAGVIGTRADMDRFSIACDGAATVTVLPAATSPNLDVQLRQLGFLDLATATASPAATQVDRDRASGLDASIAYTGNGSAVVFEVDGVGVGAPANTGYSDYASLGAYTLTATCVRPTLTVLDAKVVEDDPLLIWNTVTLTFTMQLDRAPGTAGSVRVRTADGTATAPSDYTAVPPTTVAIPAGSTTVSFSVTVNRDVLLEGDETLRLLLDSPVGVLLGTTSATGTIVNED